MKKILAVIAMLAAMAANANAFYISGSAGTVSGEDDYKATNVNVLLGMENFAIEPSWKNYSDENNNDYNTYALRLARETSVYTLGIYGGLTPDVDSKTLPATTYSNQFVGADFTISLNPIGGNNSRLVGPGNRGISVGGDGITRVDVGAGIKYAKHKTEAAGAADFETEQTEYQIFAGAKILMLNLSGGITKYDYGDSDSPVFGYINGVNYAILGMRPDTAFNIKMDIPFFPIVTPYLGYSTVKYDVPAGVKDHSNNYEFGAYLDFAMLTANVSYQIREYDGHNDGFLSAGVGLKFE